MPYRTDRQIMKLLERSDPILRLGSDLPAVSTRIPPGDTTDRTVRGSTLGYRILRGGLLASLAAVIVVALLIPLRDAFRDGATVTRTSPSAGSSSSPGSSAAVLIPPSFQAASGWETASTGPIARTEEFDSPRTWAATVSFSADLGDSATTIPSNTTTLPDKTLAALNEDSIVIVAQLAFPHDSSVPNALYPTTDLPLTLADADVRPEWEGQPSYSVPEYRIGAILNGDFYDVRVYFGTQTPSEDVLAAADAELARLQF